MFETETSYNRRVVFTNLVKGFHGGLSTTLESLAQGVPVVVLPVAYDQPGVGVRAEWSGVGQSIPVGRLTVDRLRYAVHTVLTDSSYRERAGRLRSSIEAADGLNRAADLIEGAFGTGRRALPTTESRRIAFAEPS